MPSPKFNPFLPGNNNFEPTTQEQFSQPIQSNFGLSTNIDSMETTDYTTSQPANPSYAYEYNWTPSLYPDSSFQLNLEKSSLPGYERISIQSYERNPSPSFASLYSTFDEPKSFFNSASSFVHSYNEPAQSYDHGTVPTAERQTDRMNPIDALIQAGIQLLEQTESSTQSLNCEPILSVEPNSVEQVNGHSNVNVPEQVNQLETIQPGHFSKPAESKMKTSSVPKTRKCK